MKVINSVFVVRDLTGKSLDEKIEAKKKYDKINNTKSQIKKDKLIIYK